MTIDFDKIKQAAQPHLEALCFEMFPDGDVQGDQFRIGNIRGERGHKGGSLHVDLDDGWWIDMNPAEGQHGGDIISLWAARYGMNNVDAARDLDAKLSAGAIQTNTKGTSQGNRAKSDKNDWIALPFAETEVSAPTTKPIQRNGVWAEYPISRSWEYRDAQDRQVGFICRVDFGEGVKDCFPYTFCLNSVTGKRKWNWRRFSAPRPLFNLGAFAAHPKAGVLIVEGEKKAEIMQREWPEVIVTTWVGGAAAIIYHPEEIDWTPLAGRRVTLWPDADSQCIHDTTELLPALKQPGIAAMVAVEAAIKDIAARTFIVLPPDDWKDGYDLADAIADGWTLERIKAHIAKRKQENVRVGTTVEDDIHADEEASKNAQDDAEWAIEPTDGQTTNSPDEGPLDEAGEVMDVPTRDNRFQWPFECFGTRGTTAYFRIRNSSVQSWDLSTMRQGTLECLAPVGFWMQNFPDTEKECSVSWNTALSAVRDFAFSSGTYSIMRLRGLGFWFDGNDVVIHVGDKLIVNGVPKQFIEHQSKYIYETIEDLGEDAIDYDPSIAPLTAKSDGECAGSAKILDLCKSFPWRDPMSAYFIAGWIALAPICGVLKWRPHVWITGPAGCGKSTTLLGDTVKPLLGNGLFIDVQASTTLPAISESCGNNAIPVVYDESESKNKQGQERMQRIIEQMRASSTENCAPIRKGVPGGGAVRLMKPRQMYCLASTAANITDAADLRRITKLDMYKRDESVNEQLYRGPGGTLDLISQTTSDENFCKAFRQRLYSQARITLANIKTFRKVVAKKLHDVPEGDQKGTLLAGAWGLRSSRIATEEEVTKWVDSLQWDTWKAVASDKDEYACLNLLLATQFRLEDSDGRSHCSSIGEIILDMLGGICFDPQCQGALALLRAGVKIMPDRSAFFVVSQPSHPFLRDTFSKSPFADQWKDQLMRIPGAENSGSVRFGAATYRAVKIPMSVIKPKSEEAAVEV